MAKFAQNQSPTLLSAAMIASFGNKARTSLGAKVGNDSIVGSMENLSPEALSSLSAAETEFNNGINSIIQEMVASAENFSPEDRNLLDSFVSATDGGAVASMEAASIAAMGLYSSKSASFARSLHSSVEDSDAFTYMPTHGKFGHLTITNIPAVESFDEQELVDTRDESIMYNLLASRQDAFSEMLFRTVTLTADQAGFSITIDNPLIGDVPSRKGSGASNPWDRHTLVEAFTNAEVLRTNITQMVPWVRDDNKDIFVDAADVATSDLDIAGRTVPTAPLKIGKKLNLVEACADPAILNSQTYDHTDAIDESVELKNVYVKVSKDGATSEVYRFKVTGRPGSKFQAVREGKQRKIQLNFDNSSIGMTGETTTIAGAASTILANLATGGMKMHLEIQVNGILDTEESEVKLSAGDIDVAALYNDEGQKLAKTDSDYTGLLNGVSFEVIGYDLDAVRTNSSLRARGKVLTVNKYTERYPVRLHAPIHWNSPITAETRPDAVNTLITATRVAVSNDAVTTLLNHAEALQAIVEENDNLYIGMEDISLGIGRYRVKPFFTHFEVDVEAEVNSISSAQKYADVQGLLTSVVREVCARMARDTGYYAALKADKQSEPQLLYLIGTDTYLPQFLQLTGDTRLTGPNSDHVMESTTDTRMSNKIVITFGRPGQGIDPMHYGTHAWMPEVVYNTQVARGETNVKELGAQRRNLHVPHLPIMVMITVKGLDQVFSKRTEVKLAPVEVASLPETQPAP